MVSVAVGNLRKLNQPTVYSSRQKMSFSRPILGYKLDADMPG